MADARSEALTKAFEAVDAARASRAADEAAIRAAYAVPAAAGAFDLRLVPLVDYLARIANETARGSRRDYGFCLNRTCKCDAPVVAVTEPDCDPNLGQADGSLSRNWPLSDSFGPFPPRIVMLRRCGKCARCLNRKVWPVLQAAEVEAQFCAQRGYAPLLVTLTFSDVEAGPRVQLRTLADEVRSELHRVGGFAVSGKRPFHWRDEDGEEHFERVPDGSRHFPFAFDDAEREVSRLIIRSCTSEMFGWLDDVLTRMKRPMNPERLRVARGEATKRKISFQGNAPRFAVVAAVEGLLGTERSEFNPHIHLMIYQRSGPPLTVGYIREFWDPEGVAKDREKARALRASSKPRGAQSKLNARARQFGHVDVIKAGESAKSLAEYCAKTVRYCLKDVPPGANVLYKSHDLGKPVRPSRPFVGADPEPVPEAPEVRRPGAPIRGHDALFGLAEAAVREAGRDVVSRFKAKLAADDQAKRPARTPGWQLQAQRIVNLRGNPFSAHWPLSSVQVDIRAPLPKEGARWVCYVALRNLASALVRNERGQAQFTTVVREPAWTKDPTLRDRALQMIEEKKRLRVWEPLPSLAPSLDELARRAKVLAGMSREFVPESAWRRVVLSREA